MILHLPCTDCNCYDCNLVPLLTIYYNLVEKIKQLVTVVKWQQQLVSYLTGTAVKDIPFFRYQFPFQFQFSLPYIHLPAWLPACLPVCLSACLPLSVCLPVCLSVCLYVCLLLSPTYLLLPAYVTGTVLFFQHWLS